LTSRSKAGLGRRDKILGFYIEAETIENEVLEKLGNTKSERNWSKG